MKKLKALWIKIAQIKALKYVLVTVIAVVLIGFVDENSVWNHFRNKQKISELSDEIADYTQRSKHDQEQIHLLDSDPKAMEKIARERYFMKTDDEDIFVLSDDPQSSNIFQHETVE
jgi:cell division protein FtsB